MRNLLFLLTVLLTAAIGAERSSAQVGRTFTTIEAMTASADLVVRGTIKSVAFRDRSNPIGEGRSQWKWVIVTLQVDSTLKGKAPEKIEFVEQETRGGDYWTKRKESGRSTLWFLAEIDEKTHDLPSDFPPEQKGQFYLRDNLELASGKDDKRVPRSVFSMDLQALSDEGKILEAVKAEATRRGKGATRTIGITISREVADRLGPGRSGDANAVILPVTRRLEGLGREWVAAKEPWLREAGVKALASFKCEANIAILKDMLTDEASFVRNGEDRRERVYFIRVEASNVLKKWKVAVPKCVLRETLK